MYTPFRACSIIPAPMESTLQTTRITLQHLLSSFVSGGDTDINFKEAELMNRPVPRHPPRVLEFGIASNC